MKREKNPNFVFVIIFTSSLFLTAFTSFLLVKDIYQSHKIDEQIASFEKENVKLKRKNEIWKSEMEKFKYDNYKEKFAKEKLGRKMPGEKVLIISENETEDIDNKGNEIIDEDLKRYAEVPNPKKWWLYFFGPK